MVASIHKGFSPADVKEDKGLFKTLLIVSLLCFAVTLVVAALTWNVLLFEGLEITFNSGPTILEFLILYLILSFKEVGADEIAGAFCYGKALVPLKPGLKFLPFGLIQLKKVSRTVQEFQCPGEPEQVFKGDDKDPLPEGKVRPIRAVTKAPSDTQKDILDTRMTLSVNFVTQYAIMDIFDFIANFGSMASVEKQLRDIGEITIVEKITQNTPASFIEKLAEINGELAKEIGTRFKNSGVKIISVRLISPDISHEVSTALAKIPVAKAEATQKVVTAEADKTVLIKNGEGKAAAELALLNAQAKGRKRMMEDLDVNGEAVLASEAVRGLSDKTDVLVAGAEGGMRDIMGLVKGAQSALASKSTKSKGATP